MRKTKDITGEKFGSLTVIEYAGKSNGKAKISLWTCRCECGSVKTYYGTALRSGGTKSCGCMKGENISAAVEQHGMRGTPTYNSWKTMKARCSNPNSPDYESYGGRGITVCDRWESFENFIADMGMRPRGMTLDRIDTNGAYSKENCRWATPIQQARNRKSNRLVVFEGQEMTLSEFADKIGIDRRKARYMIVTRKLSPEEIVTVTKRAGVSTIDGALVS